MYVLLSTLMRDLSVESWIEGVIHYNFSDYTLATYLTWSCWCKIVFTFTACYITHNSLCSLFQLIHQFQFHWKIQTSPTMIKNIAAKERLDHPCGLKIRKPRSCSMCVWKKKNISKHGLFSWPGHSCIFIDPWQKYIQVLHNSVHELYYITLATYLVYHPLSFSMDTFQAFSPPRNWYCVAYAITSGIWENLYSLAHMML